MEESCSAVMVAYFSMSIVVTCLAFLICVCVVLNIFCRSDKCAVLITLILCLFAGCVISFWVLAGVLGETFWTAPPPHNTPCAFGNINLPPDWHIFTYGALWTWGGVPCIALICFCYCYCCVDSGGSSRYGYDEIVWVPVVVRRY